jgi:hypothetical protein
MGDNWNEDEWVLSQALYENVGPCPARSARNGLVGYIARKVGRSAESLYMRLRNYGAHDPKATKFWCKFLSGERVPGDGKGETNRFYLNLRWEFPDLFRKKLLRACRRYKIDPAILGY